jgi:hypothetical protein
VSFAAITLCVASKPVLFVSLSTQYGNFWIHLRTDSATAATASVPNLIIYNSSGGPGDEEHRRDISTVHSFIHGV